LDPLSYCEFYFNYKLNPYKKECAPKRAPWFYYITMIKDHKVKL
jgi:hypothetical protein